MKKVIFSVLLIAIVGALVGIGTWAYFSDYETSEDNIFTAGSLDLKVDGADDPMVATYFEIECVKPGDEGMVEINLANVGCVDGVADIHLKMLLDDENVAVEPELNAGDVADDPANIWDGELRFNLDLRISADLDGDGSYETLVTEGKLEDLECINWIIGDLLGDSNIDIMIEWGIDAAVGNIIMTDISSFDIEFSLNQKVGDVILDVTDIIQADTGLAGQPYDIDVLVHNAGTITGNGWVFVSVKDATGAPVWSDKAYVEDLAPCDTTTVSFTWTPAAAGSYTVVTTDDTGVAEECPVEILEPGALVVTGIQQEDTYQIYEEIIVGVDIHNTGGVPAEGMAYAVVADMAGTPLMAPVLLFTGMVDPCQTIKLAADLGPVEEAWRGMVLVVAGFDPLGADAFPCLITVLSPPIYEITGIQQPDVVQPCEDIIVSVDIHNAGDKPGECDAVAMWIEDEGGVTVWPDVPPAYGTTGLLNPCDTAKVPFGPIHVEEAWLGQTITVFAQACGGLPTTCDIVVSGGPCLVVTGIQQPEEINVGEELVVSVDVHNAGGKPGECTVMVSVKDAVTGVFLIAPQTLPVPLLAPCDTEKIGPVVIIGEVPESWPELIAVVAQSCCGDQFDCPITVTVPEVPEPGIGSTWVSEYNYDDGAGHTFVANWTSDLVAVGVAPVPDLIPYCIEVPTTIFPGPAKQVAISIDAAYTVYKAGTPIDLFGGIGFASEATGESLYVFLDGESEGTDLDLEIAYEDYALVSGNLGKPYTVGSSWTFTSHSIAGIMGMICMTEGWTAMTVTVVAADVTVTVPAGTFTDCFEITADDPLTPGMTTTWWSPTVQSTVKSVGDESFDGVETAELISYTIVP